MYPRRLVACAALSVIAHVLVANGTARLPARARLERPRAVAVRLVEPPPPEPPLAPEPPRPRQIHEAAQRFPMAARDRAPDDRPPSERSAQAGDSAAAPVFGISMESTSQAGGGAAMPVGNTLQAGQGTQAAPSARLGAPAQPYEVTKMPLPVGRCTGKYTNEAREAGIEGAVVLDLVVGEDGRTRDITVIEGLPHGLTTAAVAALKACRFSPGERAGKPVSVRVRGFKIRFFLQEGG